MTRFLPGFSLAFAIALSGCVGTVRTATDFDTRRASVDAAAVMPPEVSYSVRTATLSEPDAAMADSVAGILHVAIERAFRTTNIRPVVLVADTLIAADPLFAEDLTRARQSFALAADSLARVRVKQIDLGVDPDVGIFADEAGTDYLVFARAAAYGSSGGAVARDVALGVLSAVLFGGASMTSPSGIVIEIGIVDANTADVVWYNRSTPQQSVNPLKLDAVEKLCKKLMEPIMG